MLPTGELKVLRYELHGHGQWCLLLSKASASAGGKESEGFSGLTGGKTGNVKDLTGSKTGNMEDIGLGQKTGDPSS